MVQDLWFGVKLSTIVQINKTSNSSPSSDYIDAKAAACLLS